MTRCEVQGYLGQSPEFMENVNRYKKDLLEEDARVLYVDVTRAKNTVVFSSGGSSKQSNPDFWSWKDEVMLAFCSMPSIFRLGTGYTGKNELCRNCRQISQVVVK